MNMSIFEDSATTESIVEEILNAVDCAIELSSGEWEDLKNYLMQRYS